jgi:LacI family transcriptional regulator
MKAVSLKRRGKVKIMAITLKEVAQLAGVSLATASRVINNRPGVRTEVRERVLKVVREHGYEPNLVARSLAETKARK